MIILNTLLEQYLLDNYIICLINHNHPSPCSSYVWKVSSLLILANLSSLLQSNQDHFWGWPRHRQWCACQRYQHVHWHKQSSGQSIHDNSWGWYQIPFGSSIIWISFSGPLAQQALIKGVIRDNMIKVKCYFLFSKRNCIIDNLESGRNYYIFLIR